MKTIKVKVHYESQIVKMFFPSWVTGVTIGPHIFFRGARDSVPAKTMNHELIHVCQYADKGVTTFLWEYLWEQRDVSYRSKPAEVEAYANEADYFYIERRWPNYTIVID
jgi:hypothetical protein